MRPRLETGRLLLLVVQFAWSLLAAVCFALFVLGVPADYAHSVHPPQAVVVSLHHHGFSTTAYAVYMSVLGAIFSVVSIGLGLVIAFRRFGDLLGLVASLFLFLFSARGSAADVFPVLTPLDHLVGALDIPVLVIFLLLFPSGRAVPRWVTTPLLLWLALTIWPALLYGAPNVNPLPQLAGVLFGIGAQVYRYRAVSNQIERQQAKWVVFAIALFLSSLFFSIIAVYALKVVPTVGPRGSSYDLTSTTIATLGFLLIPIALAIAILRHGLWEIDVLINRTLVYGSLTLTLAALYIGAVIGLQVLFRAITGQSSDLAIAVSTLLIAAVFLPWRRRLQVFIDRRFYRHKYDAARTLAAFQARLRDEVDLDELTSDLLSALQDTVQPSLVSVWIRPEESSA